MSGARLNVELRCNFFRSLEISLLRQMMRHQREQQHESSHLSYCSKVENILHLKSWKPGLRRLQNVDQEIDGASHACKQEVFW